MEEAYICFLCGGSFSIDDLSRIEGIKVVHQDGDLIDPLEALIKLSTEVNISTDAHHRSLCCRSCAKDLQDLAIFEFSLQRTKDRILPKLRIIKSEIVDPVKRSISVPIRYSEDYICENDQTFETDNISEEEEAPAPVSITQIPVVESILPHDLATKSKVYKAYIHSDLVSAYPKCTLSKLLDSKVHCLSKHCELEISFDFSPNENVMVVTSKGVVSDHAELDPNRVLFELNKDEFALEGICEFCCQRFETDDLLHEHLETSKENRHKCPLCDFESKTFLTRNRHFLSRHTNDKPYQCSKKNCNEIFKMDQFKRNHERTCLFELRFPCNQCDKTFVSTRNLSDHVKQIHDEEKSAFRYECPHCPGKKFFKKSNYESHMISHKDGKEVERHPCDECNQTFKRIRTLKAHKKHKHSDSKTTYLCKECGKYLESYTGYRQHLAQHGAPVYIKRNYSCKICEKSFRAPADLKIHEAVHTKLKKYTCDICNIGFTQKSSLKDHYNVHAKKYVCPLCEKAFGRERDMTVHLKGCNNSRDTEEHDLVSAEVMENAYVQEPAVILVDNEGHPLQEISLMVETAPVTQI